jgi:hypothetical protein
MIASPPFRFRALGDVCERVWWATPDLNPTQWTREPYTLWLRFILEWIMVCGVLCGVCGVLSMTQLNRLERLAVLSAPNEWSFYV